MQTVKNGGITPTALKRNQAQRALLAQMKRNAAQVKPTKHDLVLAQDDFDIEQKRINLDYGKALKWVAIRKR